MCKIGDHRNPLGSTQPVGSPETGSVSKAPKFLSVSTSKKEPEWGSAEVENKRVSQAIIWFLLVCLEASSKWGPDFALYRK